MGVCVMSNISTEQPNHMPKTVLLAWQELVSNARNPHFKLRLISEERELLPRFALHYARLAAMPRPTRRLMQRNWKRSIAGLALLMVIASPPAQPATINVGMKCNLNDAITAANNDMTISGCESGGGADTIVLSGNVTLTDVNSDFMGPTGLPIVTSPITIEGKGATISRASSAPEFRIFAVDGTGSVAGNLTLNRTTITGGKLTATDARGGGILNQEGELTIINSTISGNSVPNSPSDYNASGGGIAARSSSQRVTLTIMGSTITGNSGYNGGGLRHGNFGTMTITGSTVSGNSGVGTAGVFHIGDDSTISDSTISGNSGTGNYSVGGLLQGGTLTITNTTISNNSAPGNFGTGGVGAYAGGTLTLTNSTVTGNSAPNGVGGIGNSSTVVLNRTLISGNKGSTAAEFYGGATVNADNFNVFGFSGNAGVSGFSPGATDIVPSVALAKVLNTTLANNGGPTRTHALVSGSPAVNAVDAGCPPPGTDQRGIKRPQGAACDVGAFEFEGGSGTPPQDGRCAGKVTTIMGTEQRDILRGTNRADVMQGLGGNDTITGLGGNDTICGGNGRDNLLGNAGNDVMQGNNGDDQLSGNDGKDRLDGGAGRDLCDGGPPSRGDTVTRCERTRNVP